MNDDSAINGHSLEASLYDQQVIEHGYHGHEILFGLMYEFVKSGETLLDMGIGTGLSSLLFHKAGLLVSGFDGSGGMLKVCKSKGFATRLDRHDLRQAPYPYADRSYNHVVSIGVLNFIRNPATAFEEAARIIKPRGIFTFTVEEQKPGQQSEYVFPVQGSSGGTDEGSAIKMYRHSDLYIRNHMSCNAFTILKDFEFLADRYPEEGLDIYFKAYVARKAMSE